MWLPGKKAREKIGVHPNTLRNWDKNGKIRTKRTETGQRLYWFDEEPRRKVCYCRVSSQKQKDDLERQIESMRSKFPEHEIISDIGSGLNYKRKGFSSLLESSVRGNIEELVVFSRDRLCRFGFDLFKSFIEKHGGNVVVLSSDEKSSPESELTEDLLAILHVFSCRMHGLRRYSKAIKEDKNLSE